MDQNRFSQASGYHPSRHSVRDSYDNGYGMGGPVGGPPQRMRYGNRMQSDLGWNRGAPHNVYPQNGHQQSRDTVNTNGSNGSHSDGPYSNDPSSENSSIERGVPVKQMHQDMGDQHGYSSYNRGPIMEEYGQGQAPQQGVYLPQPQQQQQQQNAVPPPPPKHVTQPAPIKLNSSGSPATDAVRPNLLSKNSTNGGGNDKRRSWFKKRFSKD